MSDLETTPLHDWHEAHGARMVAFGGWHMPIQYEGILAEHRAVRERAGLFDVSHMGEVRVRGAGALDLIQRLVTNDAAGLEDGQAQYTVMTTAEGGIIDDLLVYRLAADDYMLVVNAATTPKDVAWIREHAAGDVSVEDESDRWAQIAIQGPAAQGILSRVLPACLDGIGYYRFAPGRFGDADVIVSRTGYTGEDGFEVYLPGERAAELADALLEAGADDGLVPAGLGARDTLRLEAGMLLYGTDMDESRTPVEAGLKWLVKPDKGEFIGRDAIVAQLDSGPRERMAGFELDERGVPRHDYPVVDEDGEALATVTSGAFSPTLQKGIGLAYLPVQRGAAGSRIFIEVRGRRLGATVVKTPFYKRPR